MDVKDRERNRRAETGTAPDPQSPRAKDLERGENRKKQTDDGDGRYEVYVADFIHAASISRSRRARKEIRTQTIVEELVKDAVMPR